jgi:hypothetical protein
MTLLETASTKRPSSALGTLLLILSLQTNLLAEAIFPDQFKPKRAEIRAITAPAGSTAAWETTHFSFLSDEAIDRDTLQSFATTMESVPRLLKSLPLPLWSTDATKRSIIRLCRDEERFQHFGGPIGSAGFYHGPSKTILIRADLFLDPPRAGNSRLKSLPNEDLLVHELTHLGMARILIHAKPWLYEGFAEYLAAAHQRGGYYRFDNSPQAIRDHFRRYLPSPEDGTIALPPLAQLLKTSGREWIHNNTDAADADRYRPYAAALLLVHYHLEGGPERRKQLTNYLEQLQAPRSRRDPVPVMTLEKPAEIEARLTKYWSSKGLQLRFTALQIVEAP